MDANTMWSTWGQPVIAILMATPGLAAFLVGLVFGFLGTQWIKGPAVLPHEWGPDKRRRWVATIAFLMYAIPCWLLWPLGWDWASMSYTERYLVVVLGLLAGVALGFGSMWFYGIVMKRLYEKGWASEEKWSAEGRAQAKRQKLVELASGERKLVDEDDDTTGGKTVMDPTRLAAKAAAPEPETPKP